MNTWKTTKMRQTFTLFLLIVSVSATGCSVEYVGAETSVDGETTVPTSVVSTTVATTTTRSGVPTTLRIPTASLVSTTAVTTTSTTTVTTTSDEKTLSPAWIEARQLDNLFNTYTTDAEEYRQITATYLRSKKEYWWNNPNQLSTPVGTLCWATHELSRSGVLVYLRVIMDEQYNEIANQLGLVIENSDQAPVDVLLDFLTSDPDTTVETPVSANENVIITTSIPQAPTSTENLEPSESEQLLAIYRHPGMIEWIRLTDEGAGDGTEWATALRTVSAPEIEAATKTGDGLPAEAQQFSDALFDLVDEYIDSGKTDSPEHYRLPGFAGFYEVAKYAPDCQRLHPNIFQAGVS